MAHYCDSAPGDPLHAFYHDHEYGFPVTDDAVLFERFALEINQAGLSWGLMLKKRAGFRVAFKGFEPAVVADFGAADRDRLLADAGIIRNRLKIDAVIENARRITILQAEHGSFRAWLAAQNPRNKDDWIKLFKKTFKFTGPEVVGEFLMSTGYLPGAHRSDCPVYARIATLSPPWMVNGHKN